MPIEESFPQRSVSAKLKAVVKTETEPIYRASSEESRRNPRVANKNRTAHLIRLSRIFQNAYLSHRTRNPASCPPGSKRKQVFSSSPEVPVEKAAGRYGTTQGTLSSEDRSSGAGEQIAPRRRTKQAEAEQTERHAGLKRSLIACSKLQARTRRPKQEHQDPAEGAPEAMETWQQRVKRVPHQFLVRHFFCPKKMLRLRHAAGPSGSARRTYGGNPDCTISDPEICR